MEDVMGSCWICGKNPLECSGHTYNFKNRERLRNDGVRLFIVDEAEAEAEPSNIIDGVEYVVVEKSEKSPLTLNGGG